MCRKLHVLWLKAAFFGEVKIGEILIPFLHRLVLLKQWMSMVVRNSTLQDRC